MEINFKINNKCNLDCEYCLWKQYKNYNYIDCINTLKLIKKLLKEVNDQKNIFYIHGGESTFHPKFEEIFKDLKFDNTFIELQTNLTTKNVDFLINTFDNISVSLHYKELKKRNLLDLYLENLEKVSKSGKLHNFDIMLENLGKDQKIYLDFIKNNILKYSDCAKYSEMIYAYWDNDNIMNNSEVFNLNKEFYEKYNKTEKINQKKSTNENWFNNNVNGLYCLAGCKKFHIFGNGYVYKCASHETQALKDFNKVKEDGISEPLGNILTNYNEIFKLTKEYKKCEFNYCGGDFDTPKSNSIEKLKILEKFNDY